MRRSRWTGGLIGTVGMLALWELMALTFFKSSGLIPTPQRVVLQITREWRFYLPHLETTMSEAAQGWLLGNVLALLTAIICVEVRVLERPLMRFAIISYAMPIIAIGPILQIVLPGSAPKITMAALSVYFTTLIAGLLGFRSVDATSVDMIRAYGGSSWTVFRKVRLKWALPSIFAGLRIAGPAAVLGAMIGEYLGAERGLGILLVNSQQTLNVPRTWAIAVIASAAGGFAYGLAALVGRLLTPWAPRRQATG